MINLKNVMQNNPGCLSTRASFKSVLSDIYPNERRLINILTIVYEAGMVNALKSKKVLTHNEYNSFLAQIENEYGISPKYSSEAIQCWARAYDIIIDIATCEKPFTTIVPIVHAPITPNNVVEGTTSDYETVIENGSVTITKFIGFDEREITVPNHINGVKVLSIAKNAFAKCTGIERVIVSDGIEEIHDGAFSHCTSLREVILPNSLLLLGDAPERRDNGRTSYRSYDGVFEECAIENISLPSGLLILGGKVFKYCKNLKAIDLPNSIEEICEDCFAGCVSLEKVFLPDHLKLIDENAFSSCAVVEIDIPIEVKRIYNHAFSSCKRLTRITLNEGLTTLGYSVFQNCPNLTDIVIPKSVTEIGGDMFQITGWYQPTDRRRKGYSTSKKNPNLVIGCYAGSFGLEYARKLGYPIRNAAK